MAGESNTVIVVDDEEAICNYLSAVLRFEGYECRCFSESLAALAYLSESQEPADLLLSDINMPEMTGMELLRKVKTSRPELPVILVSGLYELALALEAIHEGADDYLRKPVQPADVVNVVSKYLNSGAEEQKTAIQDALKEYLNERDSRPEASEHIHTIFQSLGIKRYETFQHSKRVAAYCRLFGGRLGLDEQELDRLELGALLHDIGKIGIPRNILLKPGPLNDAEWEVMRSHPSIGYKLLAPFPELRFESQLVYGHHERFDGGGYPRGLQADEIPLGARIFSIIDTLDAITSDRPYRAGRSFEEAFEEISIHRNDQFDPRLVDVFLDIPLADLAAIRGRYPDRLDEDNAPLH